MSLRHLSSLVTLALLATTARGLEHRVAAPAEIAKAVASAKPGDVLVLADGTYSDLFVELTCSGAEGAPITFRAATPGKAVFTKDARIRVGGSWVVVSGIKFDQVGPTGKFNIVAFEHAEHSRLTQCAFYRCGNDKWRHIVKLGSGSKHCRVDHNYFERLRGQGIGIAHGSDSSDNLIDHNWLSRTEGDGGENNGFEPIQLGQGGHDTEPMRAIVEFNLIENMFVEDDADPELISVKTGENIIRYNTFRNNSPSRCLTLRSAANCLVDGNFFFSCYIRAYGPGHRIVNNVIIGGSDGIHLPGGAAKGYPSTTNCLIAHNTVIDTLGDGIEINGTGAPGGALIGDIRIENNLVLGNRGNLYFSREGVKGVTFAQNLGFARDRATASAGTAAVAINADPKLKHAGARWQFDDQSSPAVNAAAKIDGIVEDVDGHRRDERPDIGAVEYSTAPATRRPLEPADVGPAWLGGPKA